MNELDAKTPLAENSSIGRMGSKARSIAVVKTIAIVAAFCIAAPAASQTAELAGALTGKWVGLSKNIYSIYGDVLIGRNAMEFSRQGKFRFSVVRSSAEQTIIKLDRPLGCGQFVALGPVTEKGMEFAVYASEKEALLPRRNDAYCSWGIYVR